MDYIKTVKRKDFDNQDKYLLARVKAGIEVGYTFEQCYEHWKKEKEKEAIHSKYLQRLEREHKLLARKTHQERLAKALRNTCGII